MAADEECVGYARECVRLAGQTTDQDLREQLFNMARDWLAAAMDERCSADHAVTRNNFSSALTARP